jgi:hypothetical protein
MKILLSATIISLALAAIAPAAAQSPAPSSGAMAMRRPVLLNGCSLTSASTASATAATQLSTSGSVQHTFTVMYTIASDKPVSAVQVQGSAAGRTEVWTDTNAFPKSGPVTHSVNFPGDIIVDEVSCKIQSVKFADGSTYTTPTTPAMKM